MAHLLTACSGGSPPPAPAPEAAAAAPAVSAEELAPGGAWGAGGGGTVTVSLGVTVNGARDAILSGGGTGHLVVREMASDKAVRLVFAAGEIGSYGMPPGLYRIEGIGSAFHCPHAAFAVPAEGPPMLYGARIEAAPDAATLRLAGRADGAGIAMAAATDICRPAPTPRAAPEMATEEQGGGYHTPSTGEKVAMGIALGILLFPFYAAAAVITGR